MFNTNVYQNAVGLLGIAATNGFTIKAKQGSPLDLLMRELAPDNNQIMTTQSYLGCIEHVSEVASIASPSDGQGMGYKLMSILEDRYLQPLKDQVLFTRQYVNPLVRDITDKYLSVQSTLYSTVANTDIVYMKIPSTLEEGIIGSRLEKTSSRIPEATPQHAPQFTKDSFGVEHATKSLNEEAHVLSVEHFNQIQSIYEQASILVNAESKTETSGLLQDVLNHFFYTSPEIISTYRPSYTNMLRAIVALVISENIYRNPVIGMGLDAENLTKWRNWFQQYCAYLIASQWNVIRGLITAKQVVYRVYKEANLIVCSEYMAEELSEELAGNGNEDFSELLLGVMHSANPANFFRKDQILSNLVSLGKAGKTYTAFQMSAVKTRRLSMMLSLISDHINSFATDNLSNDIFSPFFKANEGSSTYRIKVGASFEKQFGKMDFDKLDPTDIIGKVITDVCFPNTMAAEIISEIQVAFTANGDVENPNTEAMITLAMGKIVNKWLLSQIEVVDSRASI